MHKKSFVIFKVIENVIIFGQINNFEAIKSDIKKLSSKQLWAYAQLTNIWVPTITILQANLEKDLHGDEKVGIGWLIYAQI